MAEKGDRERLEPVAARMFAEGKSLTDIEAALNVSRQTLSKWKADTRRPGEEKDEWDKAKEVKRSYVERLRALFDRELSALEKGAAGSIKNVNLDGITKLGTLVQRWEQMEAAEKLKNDAARSALFLDFLRDLIAFGGRNDAGLVAVIEDNFDDIVAWGQEKYGV